MGYSVNKDTQTTFVASFIAGINVVTFNGLEFVSEVSKKSGQPYNALRITYGSTTVEGKVKQFMVFEPTLPQHDASDEAAVKKAQGTLASNERNISAILATVGRVLTGKEDFAVNGETFEEVIKNTEKAIKPFLGKKVKTLFVYGKDGYTEPLQYSPIICDAKFSDEDIKLNGDSLLKYKYAEGAGRFNKVAVKPTSTGTGTTGTAPSGDLF